MSATPEPAGASGSHSSARPVTAGLFRRLAALFYDVLLLAALLMFATWLVLPLTGGEAIAAESPRWWMLGYRLLLGAVIVAYFGLFWTRGGQTLGMLAWKIRAVRANAAAAIGDRRPQHDEPWQILVERSQAIVHPRADRGELSFEHVPPRVKLELRTVIVVGGPHRPHHRQVVGARA